MNRISRSNVLAAGALAALAAALPARAATTSLTVGATLDDDIAATLYGISAGTFAREGLDLHVNPLLSGAVGASAVASGALPIAKSSVIALIAAYARGLPFVIIAPSVVFTADKPTSGLIVRKDSPLLPGKDFNGKTIGVSSLVDARVIAIKAWTDANGGDSRTLKFIEVPASSVLAAVEAGRIDATVVSNTQLGDAMSAGTFKNLGEPNAAIGKRYIVNTWYTTRAYLAQNGDIVRHFLAGLLPAVTYANAHPAEMTPFLASFAKIDETKLQNMTHSVIATKLVPAEYQPVIDAAAKYGFIDKAFPARDFLL
ncbi:MAG: ABC transporter substrate-binding protein [Candidatus Lustribacter sp.]|jgi:NitT/TauT family transport system substrate-binding protein